MPAENVIMIGGDEDDYRFDFSRNFDASALSYEEATHALDQVNEEIGKIGMAVEIYADDLAQDRVKAAAAAREYRQIYRRRIEARLRDLALAEKRRNRQENDARQAAAAVRREQSEALRMADHERRMAVDAELRKTRLGQFLEAAKVVLDREQYLAVWAEVDRQNTNEN